MALFNGITFATDLGIAPLKHKSALKELIVQNGGSVSLMLTKATQFFVVTEELLIKSGSKIDTAKKYGVPIITNVFLEECVRDNKPLVPKAQPEPAPVSVSSTPSSAQKEEELKAKQLKLEASLVGHCLFAGLQQIRALSVGLLKPDELKTLTPGPSPRSPFKTAQHHLAQSLHIVAHRSVVQMNRLRDARQQQRQAGANELEAQRRAKAQALLEAQEARRAREIREQQEARELAPERLHQLVGRVLSGLNDPDTKEVASMQGKVTGMVLDTFNGDLTRLANTLEENEKSLVPSIKEAADVLLGSVKKQRAERERDQHAREAEARSLNYKTRQRREAQGLVVVDTPAPANEYEQHFPSLPFTREPTVFSETWAGLFKIKYLGAEKLPEEVTKALSVSNEAAPNDPKATAAPGAVNFAAVTAGAAVPKAEPEVEKKDSGAGRKLFVSNVDFSDIQQKAHDKKAPWTSDKIDLVTRERRIELIALFKQFGQVVDVQEHWADRYIFVTFGRVADCKKALNTLKHYEKRKGLVREVRARLRDKKQEPLAAPKANFYVRYPKFFTRLLDKKKQKKVAAASESDLPSDPND